MEQLVTNFLKERNRTSGEDFNLLLNRVKYISDIERACSDFNIIDKFDGIRYSIPEFYNRNKPIFEDDDIGIVIQGPIQNESNFTWRLAKLYREIYPNIKIVISTWAGESKKLPNEKNFGVDIIESNAPLNDKRHVQHQLKSTYNGLRFLKSRYNVKYALKMRGDQVFYKLDFLLYLKNLLSLHKPLDNKIKNRIIFCGHTSYYFPFFMGDFMTFSHIDVLLKLYGEEYIPSIEYDDMLEQKNKTFSKLYFSVCGNNSLLYGLPDDIRKRWQKLCKRIFLFNGKPRWFGAENYIPMRFYGKYIEDIDYENLLLQYWSFLKKYCIVLSKDELLLYWSKYNGMLNYQINSLTYNQLDYSKWLNLYMSDSFGTTENWK